MVVGRRRRCSSVGTRVADIDPFEITDGVEEDAGRGLGEGERVRSVRAHNQAGERPTFTYRGWAECTRSSRRWAWRSATRGIICSTRAVSWRSRALFEAVGDAVLLRRSAATQRRRSACSTRWRSTHTALT